MLLRFIFTCGRLPLRDFVKNSHVCVYEFLTELSVRLLVRRAGHPAVVVASIRSIWLDTALIWPKPRRSTAITLVAAQGLDLIHPQFRTGAHPCTSIKAGPEPHD